MKIDVLPIVRDHALTMRNARTDRISWLDLMIFYGAPLLLGAVGTICQWEVSAIGNILAALALMTGLLFNLLVVLFDVVVRVNGRNSDTFVRHRRLLVKELQANISYAVLVALLASVVLGWLSLAGASEVSLPTSPIVLFLLTHFVLLLAMILRRMRAVFRHEYSTS